MRWAGKCKHFRLAKPGAHTATTVAANHAVSKNNINIHANARIEIVLRSNSNLIVGTAVRRMIFERFRMALLIQD